jgi:glutamate-1-semialdehyde 2,1-aminomutase
MQSHRTLETSTKKLGIRSKSGSGRLKRAASKLLPLDVVEDIFVSKAQGSHIWDADGNEFIDYKLGYGPVILGHNYDGVQQKIHDYIDNGVIYGLDHPLEVDLAKKIKRLMPGAEKVRYFVTGTEATMNAIKIARAHTGKEKLIKFEGHYHGFHDYVSFSVEPGPKSAKGKPKPEMRGIPKALQKLVVVSEWNDFDAIEKAVKRNAKTTAAMITEPVMANSSVIPPKQGYLKFLKELCDKHGIVLIFDEVKTGFRIDKGGAQEFFGVRPHLTALAKSLGNGYPISAVTGLEEIMDKSATQDVIPQGTYARNPISLAAADATLEAMLGGRGSKIHSEIKAFGNSLLKGIRDAMSDMKADAIVQGYPSMFQILFTKNEEVQTYREFSQCDQDRFAKLQKRLLRGGILIDESNAEPFYTSSAHTNEDLEQTLQIVESSL